MSRSHRSSTGDDGDLRRNLMNNYYVRELPIWSPFRVFGLGCAFIGLILTVICMFSKEWIRHSKGRTGIFETYACNFQQTKPCVDKYPNWQNAVIGLLVFSVVFGFVATVLTICGMVTTALPKKIYYFHSAGEIYFVCALSVMIALAVYPAAIELERKVAGHTYGPGFGVGWGAVLFFLLAALCMCLDDLVRSCARCCCPPSDRDSNL